MNPFAASVLPLRPTLANVSADGRERYLAQLDTQLGPHPEPHRAQARADFARLAFPTSRQEAWKYTSLRALTEMDFPLAPASELTREVQATLGLATAEGPLLVCVNGRFSPALSRLESLPQGVAVGSLAEAVRQKHPALGAWGTLAPSSSHPFTALNTAAWVDGVWVHLAPGAQLGTLEVVHVAVAADKAVASYPRVWVVAETSSTGTVVERFARTGGAGTAAPLTVAVSEVWLGANAALAHVTLAQERALHLSQTWVHQSAHSRYRSSVFNFGGRLSRSEVSVTLAEKGAEATLDGLYLADGQEHVDHQTWVDHATAHCTSHELYKGVLGGQATGVFNGRVLVRKDAQKTQAAQANKTLLLSVDAAMDTKPQMEIFADDVKASHGAAVGQLDPAQLFYLRSRGLDPAKARELLTQAFSREVVERLAEPALRERVDGLVARRLLELAEGVPA